MAFLQDKDKETLIKFLKDNLEKKVTLKFFTQELECETCHDTRLLLQEVVALSPLLDLEVYNFILDKEKVQEYKIDKIPAIVPEGEKDYGVRFYGIPAGYEFSSFIETLLWVSRGRVDLLPETQEALQNLPESVFIQVLVTPTCPYCAQTVTLAHKMAIASDKVSSAMVEVIEFPHWAQRYAVRAVPKVVINEKVSFEGAYPEEEFLRQVIKATTK